MLVHTDDTFTATYDQATSDDLIAQAMAGEPILDKKGGEWFRISAEREAEARAAIAASIANQPTAQELAEQQIAATDKDMARVAEDWIAAIAAANPAALTWIKENRPDGLAKVNARRVLRGETSL
jgi:hypothetical protein